MLVGWVQPEVLCGQPHLQAYPMRTLRISVKETENQGGNWLSQVRYLEIGC